MSLELEIVESAEQLAVAAADHLARRIAALAEERSNGGTISLALSGGGTPRGAYARLAAAEEVPFERVEILFADERCVPEGDPESNYRLVRETLLDTVGPERFAAVHRVRGEAADAAAEAERYGGLVPDALDLCVLGVGEDSHTASLFPGDPALHEVRRRALLVEGPKPPARRITLSPGAIVAACEIVVLAAGTAKAEAVALGLEGAPDPSFVPIQLARTSNPDKRRRWIVDRPAAARLHPHWWRAPRE